ncbi:hypothetical protein KQX54_011131 [Cotesia glomerata]|uniref:Uncharacterized protein n=1 Tax=Cotesia glomerata TaxID=32391 RepID=A0AAV7J7E7_COTGL|nr:hypothetical protein KQX54_011131 [Cotesia glomerata]
MGMIKFCSIALLMTTVMTTGTAKYIPASNNELLEKLSNQYDPSGVNYDYGEDDQDNQYDYKFLAVFLHGPRKLISLLKILLISIFRFLSTHTTPPQIKNDVSCSKKIPGETEQPSSKRRSYVERSQENSIAIVTCGTCDHPRRPLKVDNGSNGVLGRVNQWF